MQMKDVVYYDDLATKMRQENPKEAAIIRNNADLKRAAARIFNKEFGKERDPNGLDLKTPGSKADSGKAPITRGLLGYFPRGCLAVASVSQRGAEKYSWKGWETVPDGVNRYLDALGRHLAYREIEGEKDKDTGLDHLAQVAWNSLAALELYLKEQEDKCHT